MSIAVNPEISGSFSLNNVPVFKDPDEYPEWYAISGLNDTPKARQVVMYGYV